LLSVRIYFAGYCSNRISYLLFHFRYYILYKICFVIYAI